MCEGEVELTPYGARNRHCIARGSHYEDQRFKGSITLSQRHTFIFEVLFLESGVSQAERANFPVIPLSSRDMC